MFMDRYVTGLLHIVIWGFLFTLAWCVTVLNGRRGKATNILASNIMPSVGVDPVKLTTRSTDHLMNASTENTKNVPALEILYALEDQMSIMFIKFYNNLAS